MIGQPAADQHGQDALIADQTAAPAAGFSPGTPLGLLRRGATWPATFAIGRLMTWVRCKVARAVPPTTGAVLEVGVGDGASLASYPKSVPVSGVDEDAGKLAAARARVAARALDNIQGLHRMSAAALKFPDAVFDRVAAYRIVGETDSDLARGGIIGELSRVVRGGGCLLLIERAKTADRMIPREAAQASGAPAWLSRHGLTFRGRRRLDPLGVFVALSFRKADAAYAAT